ncbi:MAG: hypothetical protein J5449_09475 [Oscillospiraceae bacterium]|nr:hypothetical protein [Oscillospiraceae bacterium]
MNERNGIEHFDESTEKTVICKSCGADYAANIPNCPYCGTMNLPVAEDEYMDKLESVRSDLENLGDLAARKGKAHMKALYRRLLIIAAVLALAIAVGFGVHLSRERAEAKTDKAEYLWQREFFPQLDACYDAGDYDALRALYEEGSADGHYVWQYKRRAFCEYLVSLNCAEASLREVERGSGDLAVLFTDEFELYRLERENSLSAEERELLEEMRAPLLNDFAARFPMTDEEFAEFRRMLDRDGFVPFAEAERFLKEKGMI